MSTTAEKHRAQWDHRGSRSRCKTTGMEGFGQSQGASDVIATIFLIG